jgi:hypothetical protein
MASAACDYVGSYILKMDDWNDGNVNITCEGDIANATVVIPEHKVKASSVELTITGNKVKLEMKSDGRRVTIKLSGNRERLTGTVKFKYRNGPGYGRGGASMTPVE